MGKKVSDSCFLKTRNLETSRDFDQIYSRQTWYVEFLQHLDFLMIILELPFSKQCFKFISLWLVSKPFLLQGIKKWQII